MVKVPHRDLAVFVKRMLDLIKEVLSHHVVELLGAPNIDFTAHLSTLDPVPIILGTGGREVHNVVVPFDSSNISPK